MNGNQVRQSNIQAEKVIGRDEVNFNIHRTSATQYMESLMVKFKEEQKNNTCYEDIIDDLKHYSTAIENEKIIGLEAKLIAGNRETYIPFAIQTKEKFYKKLKKNEYSESAQEIYTFLLAEIYSNFNHHIYPLLNENHPLEYINKLIEEFVINPVQDILGENILRILKDDINGMLYYLTDNCHIKWK
jgi:hypothetical protein